MFKKLISSIVLISTFTVAEVYSQFNFHHLIGGPLHERAQAIFSTYDNGYLVNGVTTSYGIGDVDALTLKTDAQGQILWSFTYGTPNYDNPEIAIQTFDHNMVFAGRTNVQPGSTSALIYKLDSAGNVLWSKVFGLNSNTGFVSLIETSDHGYAAVGNIPTAILLVKTTANGDTLFTRKYDGAGAEFGASLFQLPDSGFLICGRQQTTTGGNLESDGILLRTDASGNITWTKSYGDSLWEEFTSVQPTNDGGFIITGSTVTFGAGNFDILLMKTDSTGDILWTKTFGGAESDASYDIHVNPDDSYVLSGYTESLGYGHRGIDSSNVFLLKTNNVGDLVWMQVYGDGLQDEAFRSNKANDGGYLISGFTRNYILNDSSQILFIKTDSLGNTGCHEQSVQPADSNIVMPYVPVNFIQSSGLPLDTILLIRSVANPPNEDACLFSALKSSEKYNPGNRVYPNPFTSHLLVDLKETNSKIVITDLLGHPLITMAASVPAITINTEELKAGVYLISIISSDRSLERRLIIKE